MVFKISVNPFNTNCPISSGLFQSTSVCSFYTSGAVVCVSVVHSPTTIFLEPTQRPIYPDSCVYAVANTQHMYDCVRGLT